MADNTRIEWADCTWGPIRARLKGSERWGYHCEHISEGCRNCYAETMNGRMLPAWGTGLKYNVPNREKVEIFLDEKELLKPLSWKKPRRVFPGSMTDWCAAFVPDEMRDRMLAVEALCPQHTFLHLTKRAKECAEYFSRPKSWSKHGVQRTLPGYLCRKLDNLVYGTHMQHRNWVDGQWPLPNVWIGFSAENQECFDARWKHMRKLAEAGWKVWCSAEPLLGPINAQPALADRLGWIVVGGESGHGARPFDIQWARDIIRQCRVAGLACFVKQVGAKPFETNLDLAIKRDGLVSIAAKSAPWLQGFCQITDKSGTYLRKNWKLKNRKGSDPSEWPEDIRVRDLP